VSYHLTAVEYIRRVLPQPMLARADRLPGGDYSYEVKWDGFRAIVSTEHGLEVRSRRGWGMADRLPELRVLPAGLVLDGELVAFAEDGKASLAMLPAAWLGRTSRGPESNVLVVAPDRLPLFDEPVQNDARLLRCEPIHRGGVSGRDLLAPPK
jgi:ATP-dependent DNA ligase